jgi:hypothetical protein
MIIFIAICIGLLILAVDVRLFILALAMSGCIAVVL